MLQIVLDTETTGLDPHNGHRIIEIGCIVIDNRRISKKFFHHYLNPEREIEQGAQAVHGISDEFLKDKSKFSEIAEEFLKFIQGSELIIHNAGFDVSFLEVELKKADKKYKSINHYCKVIDTLALARQKHPGQRNSLDALCKRYNIDNSHREYHGALLDARLLASVYLHLTAGQNDLFRLSSKTKTKKSSSIVPQLEAGAHLVIQTATAEELQAHHNYLQLIDKKSKGKTLWREVAEVDQCH